MSYLTGTSTEPRHEPRQGLDRNVPFRSNRTSGVAMFVLMCLKPGSLYIYTVADINSAEGVPGMRTTVLTLGCLIPLGSSCVEKDTGVYLFLVNKTTCIYQLDS